MTEQDRAFEANYELPYGPQAAWKARRVVEQLAPLTDAEITEDLKLLISEIVTNSVRHAPGDDKTKIGLALKVTPGSIRAEVKDQGKGFKFTRRGFSPAQSSGWGLNIVDTLADRWGIQTGETSTVWLELDLDKKSQNDLDKKDQSFG